MLLKENAEVLTANGQKIGRIDRIVVEPETEAVTHLVVKKGILFTCDKVVPVDQVASTTDDQVWLKNSAEEPDELPDFEETEYVPAMGVEDVKQQEAEQARRLIWYHSRINLPWWAAGPSPGSYAKPQFVKKTQRNIPEGTVPLEDGAKVVDAAGEHLGEVEKVYAEPREHRVTHLLISGGGILSKHKKLIPTAWVKDIFEDYVRLTVRKKVIENLPEAKATPVSGH